MRRSHRSRRPLLGIQGCLAWLVLASCPAVGVGANVYPVNLTLVPPGDSNTIDLSISGTLPLVGTKTDSDTGTVTGTIAAALGVVIDAQTMNVTEVQTIEFTGGRILISDMSFGLSWFLAGSLDVETDAIGGTFGTPSPPASVSGGSFQAGDHIFTLNEGSFSAQGDGLIVDYLPANPYVIDMTAEPIEVTTAATGTIVVSAPSIEGDLATYEVTLTIPLEINELVFEEPDVGASVSAIGSATIEARGSFSQSLPDFGAVTPPVATGLEEASVGATSFARGAGDVELEWAMETIELAGTAAVQAGFTDPGDPSNLHQFHANNANVVITTEPIDVQQEEDPRISVGLRTWDTSSGFESDDSLEVAVLVGYDGIQFEDRIVWFRLAGPQLTALNGGRDGPFTTYETPASFLPASTKSIRVELTIDNNSLNEHVFWDNLRVGVLDVGVTFRRGDANADGKYDLSDAVFVLGYLFLGGGPLQCLKAADTDDTGTLELTDAIRSLNYLFLGGPAPSAPFAECGVDTTADDLTCDEFTPCE